MKNLFRFIKISSKLSKSFIILLVTSAIFGSLATIFAVYSPKIIIESLENGKDFNDCLLLALGVVGINFIFGLINNYFTKAISVRSEYVSNAYNFMLGEKVLSIEYSYLEDPYYLDLKERAIFACQNQSSIRRLVSAMAEIIKYAITLISLVVILSSLGIWMILIVSIAVVLNGIIIFFTTKYNTRFYKMLIPVNRTFGYYNKCVLNSKLAKDYRLYNANDLMLGRMEGFLGETMLRFGKLFNRMGFSQALMMIISGLQSFAVYAFVAYKTIKEHLSIGTFSLYVSSAISFSTAISQIISSMSQMWQCASYVEPFLELLEIKDESASGKMVLDKAINSIEFKDVSFHYPHQENLVLQHISFRIENSEHISIVGLNGAGKTTLIKLLCRLYHPTSGEIYVNGVNIFDYEINSYNQQIACVFQDYKLFAFTISENISGDEINDKKVIEIIDAVGLKRKISELPSGLNSILSKSLDDEGVEISGGENQKIAIARAIYKQSSLLILDEPTSALDPMAEADIYENFHQMARNKMAIYISHRMSSSVFCDKVLVVDHGGASDFAPHDKLMKKTDSLYYKLFTSQSKNYQNQ